MTTTPSHPRTSGKVPLALRALAAGLCLALAGPAGASPGNAPAPESSREARSFLDHGQDFARNGQWEAAIALYKNALDINPSLADAHFLLGVAYHQQRDAHHAVASLRRASQLNPRSARTFYNLGVAYARTGEMGKEIDAYHRAIRLDPEHVSAHYNLATAYWAQGRDGMACGELYQAGRLYQQAGRTDQARDMLYLIQRISPESAYRTQLAKVLRD